jgi:AcrR family transcriptional regulator
MTSFMATYPLLVGESIPVVILVNMFIESQGRKMEGGTAEPRRGRGRPRGLTAQGMETRNRMYLTAIRLIAARGWQATTLRDVAGEADVSVGLLYRYFPSKRAIVLALYDELSVEFAARAAHLERGPWRDRFIEALRTSLDVLRPHRDTLAALVPVLVGDANDGLFAPSTAFSRLRVARVFREAIMGATDAPRPPLGPALARLLYLLHLATILWWLMDRSPEQRATERLLALLERALPLAALGLRVRQVRTLIVAADGLVREALFDDTDAHEEG